jgi:hypothetical protein
VKLTHLMKLMAIFTLVICVAGCEHHGKNVDGAGGSGGMGGAGGMNPMHAQYEFESRFVEGESSVSSSGQIARHALISAMKTHIGGLTARVDDGSLVAAEGTVASELNLFFDCPEDACEGESTGITTMPGASQSTIGDISGGKNLVGKIAGNDATGQHKDWTQAFVGWGDGVTPEGLVRTWIGMLDAAAVARSNNLIPNDPSGMAIDKIYVTPEGHDLAQLLQKFLLGAVAFSQGADDYLDDDIEGKGLLASNDSAVEGKSYSNLEHNWDEGFGYFGAARNYMNYTDDEIAGKGGREDYQGYHDTNGDEAIDLTTEYNFGHAVNAAKRDRGHSINLTMEAFRGFHMGRTIINNASGALSEEQMSELKVHRDAALSAWEKAIAATVVHYINDVVGDMEAEDYSFYDHAKHWSEMKGFALSFQFNRRSPLSSEDFGRVHAAMGTAPELNPDNFETYTMGLLMARGLIAAAYQFSEQDVTDW